MTWIACTRMYDVTPQVHGALARVASQSRHDGAAVPIECIDHAARRRSPTCGRGDDLAAAFMCGFPLATRYPRVRPLAAPVTVLAEHDRPTYRSVWLVRADSAFDSLASTFGHRIGWMADHSHSGFNAPRHALLAYRTASRPTLYRDSIGPLGHPRAALAALADGRVDVTPSTRTGGGCCNGTTRQPRAPSGRSARPPTRRCPRSSARAPFPRPRRIRLTAALLALHEDSRAASHLPRSVSGGLPRSYATDYAPLADIDRAARAAGYPLPA